MLIKLHHFPTKLTMFESMLMIDRSWVMSSVTKLSFGCLASIVGAFVLICLGDSLASLEIVSYSLTNSMLPRLAREGT